MSDDDGAVFLVDDEIPEPTGLGAVVEDAHGELFVRCFSGDESSERAWKRDGKTDRQPWATIGAAYVLSEGVQP